jgi:DNA replicative helicase MCM subunit Mcm2 (Cdc46/Mcm family)
LPLPAPDEDAESPVSVGDNCPRDTFMIVSDFSRLADCQYIKIQERSENVPLGKIPRRISGFVDRVLANVSILDSRNFFAAIYEIHFVKKNMQRLISHVICLMKIS